MCIHKNAFAAPKWCGSKRIAGVAALDDLKKAIKPFSVHRSWHFNALLVEAVSFCCFLSQRSSEEIIIAPCFVILASTTAKN